MCIRVESCHQGLIVSLGLSRCRAGAVVLSYVVVTVLWRPVFVVKSLSERSLFVSLISLKLAQIMAFR
jgi:hypothetical protein